jgi:organic solute transporter subunit alpha
MKTSSSLLNIWSNYSNASQGVQPSICRNVQAPRAQDLIRNLPPSGWVLLSILFFFTSLTIAIYIEEIVFILKTFKISMRRKKTIWILAFYPVFSFCGLLACIVPRAGTLIDMVANLFFGTCLYNFGRLIINYMGGAKNVWRLVGDDRQVRFNTLPCCCCCLCIPTSKLTTSLFARISFQVMQVAIVRPVIMFLAAVLWTNGSYMPGDLQLMNAYVYVTVINLTSTVIAVYGLMLFRGTFAPELEQKFAISGKIMSIQLALIISILPNVILSFLVLFQVIPCRIFFSSKTIAEEIYHAILVLMMLPFGFMARHFFRRISDGSQYATHHSENGNAPAIPDKNKLADYIDELPDPEVMTGSELMDMLRPFEESKV